MLLWCAVAMFLCGWLALGKALPGAADRHHPGGSGRRTAGRPDHRAVAEAATLSSAPCWRCCLPVSGRSGLSCTGASDGQLTAFNRLYLAGFSPNLVERPRLEKHMQKVLNDVVKMRGLITPASKETHIRRPSLRRSRPSAVTWCACWAANQRLLGVASGHFVM